MQEGRFPIRYLPLIIGKLSKAECKTLVDRIIEKVLGWAQKTLSYTRRTQLIKAVIFSMQVY
jgi:hypothetical protein